MRSSGIKYASFAIPAHVTWVCALGQCRRHSEPADGRSDQHDHDHRNYDHRCCRASKCSPHETACVSANHDLMSDIFRRTATAGIRAVTKRPLIRQEQQ
jgi:hypothetical protein